MHENLFILAERESTSLAMYLYHSLPSNMPISEETSRQDGRGPCLYQDIILHQLFKESLLDGLICSLLVILFYFSI